MHAVLLTSCSNSVTACSVAWRGKYFFLLCLPRLESHITSSYILEGKFYYYSHRSLLHVDMHDLRTETPWKRI